MLEIFFYSSIYLNRDRLDQRHAFEDKIGNIFYGDTNLPISVCSPRSNNAHRGQTKFGNNINLFIMSPVFKSHF